jgi:hypothetical protein
MPVMKSAIAHRMRPCESPPGEPPPTRIPRAPIALAWNEPVVECPRISATDLDM